MITKSCLIAWATFQFNLLGSVQYMEEGGFCVLLLGEGALTSPHTQPLQCRNPYDYVAPREEAPEKN